MQRTCMDVRNDFTEAEHNLMEIEHQIIDYINQIDQQSEIYKKIRRLKYLKDQITWKNDTNVISVLESKNPIWMEKRHYNRIFLSLDMLRSREDVAAIIRKISQNKNIRRLSRSEAEPLDSEFMKDDIEVIKEININEIWNAFKAQGNNLFTFIKNYPYKEERRLNDHIVLYCQIATQHSDELRFTESYEIFDNIEYVLIYAK